MEKKKQAIWRYSFAIIIILTGLILNYKNIGKEFLNFNSIGNWLIYIGFVMLAIVTLQFISGKKRIVDERSQFIGMKASRITYVAIILVAFVTMVIDGIKTITIPYSQFMSAFVCGVVLVYLVSYKILEKKN
jgi:hypothetical protein